MATPTMLSDLSQKRDTGGRNDDGRAALGRRPDEGTGCAAG